MKLLVTGGAGYIGTHTCVELLAEGHTVVVLDNFCNSSPEAIRRVEVLSEQKITLVEGDVRNTELLDQIFEEHRIEGVIHFAGLKAVGESVQLPLDYFDTNISGTIALCQTMKNHQIKNLVFSSSATVYGQAKTIPIKENSLLSADNPYGRSKLFVEEILTDLHRADPEWNIILLRYFNPVGAHPSGQIGEDPKGIPNNLLPYITQVAVGRLACLNIFGHDYPTPDGTGIRDYIHVVDLARGHVHAVQYLQEKPGLEAINLGTGHGYSVLDMVSAFQEENQVEIKHKFVNRRDGDVAECFADVSLAKEKLGWSTTFNLQDIVRDAWRWQSTHPAGFVEALV